MSIAFAMILFGGLLVYGGWTNRSVWALARGDNTVAKPTEQTSTTNIQGPASDVATLKGALGTNGLVGTSSAADIATLKGAVGG